MIEQSLGSPLRPGTTSSAGAGHQPAFNPLQAPIARQALAALGGPG